MSFTVDDFQDLLRLLDQHPDWRTELRRHVLTEELLSLPAIVRELAEAQRRTEQRVGDLASTVGALVAQVGTLAERVGGLADRVGTLEGNMLELRYARRAPGHFGRLALRLREVEPAVLAELLDDAVQESRLTDAERDGVMLADIVLRGRRREDRSEVYLLVEVSSGVGLDDVQHALDRASVLAKLGRPVLPVVAGRWINDDAAAIANDRGVRQVMEGRTPVPEPA